MNPYRSTLGGEMLLDSPALSQGTNGELTFEENVHNYYSNWVWRAIHALMDHKDFDSTLSWIAEKLDIEVIEVVEAIEGLEKIGLVQKTDKGYVAKHVQFLMPDSCMSVSARLDYHRITTEQILNRMEPDPNKITAYQNFFASSKKKVNDLYSKLRQIIEDFEKENQHGADNDGVYGLSFSTVDLLINSSEEGGKS